MTVRVLDGRDLTVDRLEVTQALQDGANSLPLIRGRRTVVRAYLGIGQDTDPVPFVTGKLNGYAGATFLGSVAPFNPGLDGFGGTIDARLNPDWHQLNDTLNFEVPYAWTLQPALRLEVEVNPDHTVLETNYTNNKLTTSALPLRACGSVSVAYLPVHYTPPGGYSPADPGPNLSAGAEFMRKIYPIAEGGLNYFLYLDELPLYKDININGNGYWFAVELLSDLLSSGPVRADHIFGWLPPNAYLGGGGGYINGKSGFGNDTESPNVWRKIFAHEIGHNYGLNQDNSQAAPLTTAGAHWFDVFERVIKPVPASLGGTDLIDVMEQGHLESEVWISPQNYQYLVDKICPGGTPAAPAAPHTTAAVATVLVTGIFSNTTPAAGSLQPLYHFTTVPTNTLPVGAQACVNLRNAANTLLSRYCFDPGFSDGSGTPAVAVPFGMVVPEPAGLTRVDLVAGASLLSSQIASANPPTVTIGYPNAAGLTISGTQVITWKGQDDDGNPLTYKILYSRDNGGSWMGIGSGITRTNYTLNFSVLPGTTGASGLIKVMASDGFSSTEVISNNPFTVANKPPDAAVIISPPTGAEFTTGPKIVLEGAGQDLENGLCCDTGLSWASSLDGALGDGSLLEVNLSPGLHTITLTAHDSGLITTASVQILVVAPRSFSDLFLPLIQR